MPIHYFLLARPLLGGGIHESPRHYTVTSTLIGVNMVARDASATFGQT